MQVLAINPGATSTKFAVYNDKDLVYKKSIAHTIQELSCYKELFDQYSFRLSFIVNELTNEGIDLKKLSAIVGRGGLLKPLKSGTYHITEKMIVDLKSGIYGEHASNLGAIMAFNLAKEYSIPAFIVDPVSVDEMEPVARISGMPDLQRISFSHALNTKAVARQAANQLGKKYEDMNMIIVHLGTGISVTPHLKGRMIDVNNAQEEGPFSPDRCGGLPAKSLVKLCYSGKYTYKEMLEKISGKGGLYAYLGTSDLREIELMASDRHEVAELLLQALAYQVAKEIGAMSAVLYGDVNLIVLTGGMAYSVRLVEDITKRVSYIAKVSVLPGEEELESLAYGALRVLQGLEFAKDYD